MSALLLLGFGLVDLLLNSTERIALAWNVGCPEKIFETAKLICSTSGWQNRECDDPLSNEIHFTYLHTNIYSGNSPRKVLIDFCFFYTFSQALLVGHHLTHYLLAPASRLDC